MQISLVQPNFRQGGKTFEGYWLPHSIACVYTYVEDKNPDYFDVNRVIFRREGVVNASKSMRNDDIVLFSNYMWNWQYNLELSKRLREVNPDVVIVFGGPQVSEFRLEEQTEQYDWVDSWVVSEGELSFELLIDNLRNNGKVEKIYKARRLDDLDIPSPYTNGFFDSILKDNPDIKWSTTLETNRGCPFKCTFCDWGSLTYSKIKKFPMPKVYQEIEWLGKNKIEYIFVADANFGVFPPRDSQIVDVMLEVQEKYGYPKVFNANWHKNSKQNVIPIVKKLTSNGMNRGMTLSVQSMDDDVLRAIDRKNMDISHLKDMFDLIEKEGLGTYTELILPLPLETVTTWRKGLAEILDIGQHNSIEIWFHQLLENAQSNLPGHKDQYGFKSVELAGYVSGDDEPEDDGILERTEVVIETNTMPFEDFIGCWMYATMIINFHCGGWTQLLARYCHQSGYMNYEIFYNHLYGCLDVNRGPVGDIWRKVESIIRNYTQGKESPYSGHTLLWYLNRLLHENNEETREFIKQTFFELDEELMQSQFDFMYSPDKLKDTNFTKTYGAYWFDYLKGHRGAVKRGNATVIFEHEPSKDVEDHLEKIYFKRRFGYGKYTINYIDGPEHLGAYPAEFYADI